MSNTANEELKMKTPATYSVNLWGSNPEDDNDDCWTGDEFSTLAEALACARDWREHFNTDDLPGYYSDSDVAYVEVDGVDENGKSFYQLTKNPKHRRARRSEDREWKSEAAMQAGMAFGVDGYNDEMGW